ncbi:hypothetical protein ANAEL_01022 [Anaerolineales bacterium]|nr:hypothetical protein ANAEL_01022 [Anaerolineales bacterium]
MRFGELLLTLVFLLCILPQVFLMSRLFHSNSVIGLSDKNSKFVSEVVWISFGWAVVMA